MSIIKRVGIACAAAVSLATLGGCVDDYGYGGVDVGYGPGYDSYYDGYYGAYGDPYFGTAYPGYYGWYGGFYYPGSGIYVYDRYRHPYRWNGSQRRYWQGQVHGYNGGRGFRGSPNWGGFDRGHFGGGGGRPSGQAFRGGGGFHGGGHGGFHGGGGGHHR